jgi:hypothetical protein
MLVAALNQKFWLCRRQITRWYLFQTFKMLGRQGQNICLQLLLGIVA